MKTSNVKQMLFFKNKTNQKKPQKQINSRQNIFVKWKLWNKDYKKEGIVAYERKQFDFPDLKS